MTVYYLEKHIETVTGMWLETDVRSKQRSPFIQKVSATTKESAETVAEKRPE